MRKAGLLILIIIVAVLLLYWTTDGAFALFVCTAAIMLIFRVALSSKKD